jgi:hypothetical protein
VKEVLDFFQVVLRNVGDVEVLGGVWVVARYGQNLVVRLSAIEHHQHANRPRIDLASREGRLIDQNKDVARVAILVERARDEAVVTRIVYRRVEHAIEA